MSLIKRESTPAQVAANRANSLRSTGPRTPMGLEVSARNLPRQRRFSEVVARSMEMLGEAPGDFERMHQTLSEALRPRDSWEAATVQDLAILRHRLERLHRAELAAAALRRRRAHYQRQIAVAAPTGIDAFQLNTQIASAGYTGIPDCPLKFHLIFDLFQGLKRNLLIEQFEKDDPLYFKLLYGEARGPRAVELQTRFDRIAEQHRGGNPGDTIEDRKSLCAELDKEINYYQKLQERCVAEHVESDPSRTTPTRCRRCRRWTRSSAMRLTWRLASKQSSGSFTPGDGSRWSRRRKLRPLWKGNSPRKAWPCQPRQDGKVRDRGRHYAWKHAKLPKPPSP